jgi:hypothetical protein
MRTRAEISSKEINAMKKPFVLLVLLALTASACQGSASSPKLYVFDCGRLKSGNPAPLIEHGLTTTDMSVAAYLIAHPRGTLLRETGVIPDEMI